MTGFDAFAILVILASAAAGWVRGGTREIITLLSFVLAAFIALVALPLTAGAARTIQMVLPGIGRGMDAVSPVVDSSVRRGFSDGEALPPPQTGDTSPDVPAE